MLDTIFKLLGWQKKRIAERWIDITQGMMNEKITLNDDPMYHIFHADERLRATEEANKGNFDKSIEIYLDVIEREKRVNSAMLVDLYYAVLCSGRLRLAYDVIIVAEQCIKLTGGPLHPSGETWGQERDRKDFEFILQLCGMQLVFPTWDSGLVENLWLSLMKKYHNDGVGNMHFDPTELKRQVEACLDRYYDVRKMGVL